MKAMHRFSLRGIQNVVSIMERELPEWFSGLNPDRKFELAVELLSSQKTSIQKYRFLLDVIPWIVALVALLKW